MTRPYVLAIDQGTTNTKVLAVDADGRVLAKASEPLPIAYPEPGWVQCEAQALWNTVQLACAKVLAELHPQLPAAIGISNQRESTLAWDKRTGEALGPVVVWQCRRSTALCDRVREHASTIHKITGLGVDPLFSSTKMQWLLQNIPQAARAASQGHLALGTVDAWLLWNLTGGAAFATDASNASRTQLYGLQSGSWDAAMCELFDVPMHALPEIKATNALFGHTASGSGLPAGVPIFALFADSHAAFFAHGATQGGVKATYGTGSSLLATTPQLVLSQRGLSSTVAWRLQGDAAATFALEGNVAVAGAALQWLAQVLFGNDDVARVAALAASVPDAAGVYLVPAFVGLGAPHWEPNARGLLTGLTRGTTAAHICRAGLESLAYQVKDVITALEAEQGAAYASVFADGGASGNDSLMQFQADTLDRQVLRASQPDLSALGTAYMAGLGAGLWNSVKDVAALPKDRHSFVPRMPAHVRETAYEGWKRAIAQVLERGH
ncbi:MAG: glycerol kinase GlpK [Deltaproteobacteria bacterium]|nr:glycerol kinase GlpK [Deltaproteobacteria bacterium]